VEQVRTDGPISGLIHLASLRGGRQPATDATQNSKSLDREAKGLFLLAKEVADDLQEAAGQGGGCLIAATSMGGSFGIDGRRANLAYPAQGAVAGLVKTLAREWPGVRARVVDLDVGQAIARNARRLVLEATTNDDWAEVGYHDNRRIRLQPVSSPWTRPTGKLDLRPGEPIVISGGARGISALVAKELARRYQPTLLLLGTTPLPPDVEDPTLAQIHDSAALKAALLHQLQKAGQTATPRDLELAYQTVRRAREIRRNLAEIRAAGSRVEYAQVDVRDAAQVGRVLADWQSRFGPPVGLIHGAGLIRDKLLRDKSLESFDRVLSTKLDGALHLVHHVRPDALRFTAFFSSIAGRFGNRGQSDYAAANEAINKLAIWLDRRWPGRVVSLIWGPWSGVGMVSDLEGHLDGQGLGMIAPEIGVSAMLDELTRGQKGEIEVILAGDLGALDGPIEGSFAHAEAR
jgi:NAD(P)-dependent dehydrogenase (short-subunit alcohol dehydrogenase family)